MEQKLQEYRALRRRKELIDNTKEKIEKTKKKFYSLLIPKFITNMRKDKEKKEEEVLLMEDEQPQAKEDLSIYNEEVEEATELNELEPIEEEPKRPLHYSIIKWTLYSIIWLSGYILFLYQGFGAVYFAISVLIGICLNTSTKRKRPGEISAYSVFNRNCESIDGTLKAEELQRQMMFGMGGVRLF